METLESVGRQIASVQDLQSVVITMKGMAAANIRLYEQATRALREYNRSLELGMQILLLRLPSGWVVPSADPAGRLALIVVGSDQGMCGQFNPRIVAHATRQLENRSREFSSPLTLVVGHRAIGEWDTSRYPLNASLGLPGSVAEITRCVREMLLQINRWREAEGINRVWLFHHRPLAGASYEPHFEPILPLSDSWLRSLRRRKWPTRNVPMFSMDWRSLLSALIRQHLFAAFYRAVAESLEAENTARLASMQAAEKNVEERIDELTEKYHRRRQNAITEELLDLTAGFEALEDHR
jgi:F-type H+-transporting ATPase subunit gamma